MIFLATGTLAELTPYLPLLQTCVWPVFIGVLLLCFRRQVISCVRAVRRRIEKGSSFKAGPLEIGEDLKRLDYAPPQPGLDGAAREDRVDWVTERNGIYKANSGLFLTHVLSPSVKPGQEYDIFIYLIRHKTTDMTDVDKAEFFFGHMWGNQVFTETVKGGKIGISTSAYGPFLCTCRVHLSNGHVINLHRYVDFEMGRLIAAQ